MDKNDDLTLTYPARFDVAEDGVTVTFPDLPEAITGGDGLVNVLDLATDCLEEAIAGRVAYGEDLPPPSKPQHGEVMIICPSQTAIKAALYLAMRRTEVSKAELARRLDVNEKEIRRMVDPKHATRQASMDAAIRACGYVIEATMTLSPATSRALKAMVGQQTTAKRGATEVVMKVPSGRREPAVTKKITPGGADMKRLAESGRYAKAKRKSSRKSKAS